MPKIKMDTNVLAPAEAKTVQYAGPGAARVLKIMPDLILDTFGIDAGSFWEDKIKWDASDDPISFYGLWRGRDGKDAFTTFWIQVEVSGTQSKDRQKGDVSIIIKPKLKTVFEYNTPFHRAAYMIYKKFYKKQLLRYMQSTAKQTDVFENSVRSAFNILGRGV